MAREDRKRRVLEVLDDTNAAFPIQVLLRNLKMRGATFEKSSLRRYLDELTDEGLVTKIDPQELDNRTVVEVPPSEEGYYIITDDGRRYLE